MPAITPEKNGRDLPIDQLVSQTRTCRRFRQDSQIPHTLLHELINLARLSGSARNGQPWQYMAINDPALNMRIFPFLGWAGYLTNWRGPETGEQPAAYILCFLNTERLVVGEKDAYFDLGIASQSLLLGAAARNILGCRIGAFSPKLADLFTVPEHLRLELVIALGQPAEQVVVEEMQGDSVVYWRDDEQVHHVPKRSLDDVLVDLPIQP